MPDNPTAARLAPQKVKTYSFRQLHKHPRSPESLIISDGLLKRNSMMIVGGPPKAFKSFIMLSIAISLTTGRNLFGAHRSNHGRCQKVFTVDRPRRVLFFEQEIGEDDLEDRILPFYLTMLPDEQERFRNNFYSHSLDRDLRFDTVLGAQQIENLINEVSPEIVMFDPLIEFHDQEENSPTAMSGMLKNLMKLCDRTNTSPILSHHEGKDNGEPRSGGDRLRGASSLYGKGDTFLNLRVINRNAMRIAVEFTLRRGKPLRDMMIKLDGDSLEPRFLCWQGDKLWKKSLSPIDETVTIDDESDSDKVN